MRNYFLSPRFFIKILYAIAITLLFGAVLSPWSAADSLTTAWQMLLIAGSGWFILLSLSFFYFKNTDLYPKHLANLMVGGVHFLIPAILILGITAFKAVWIPVICVVMSFSWMLSQEIKTSSEEALPKRHALLWFLSLSSTALIWIFLFF